MTKKKNEEDEQKIFNSRLIKYLLFGCAIQRERERKNEFGKYRNKLNDENILFYINMYR